MSREKSLLKNTFIISLGTLLPRVASFITLPIITAGLTKAELGIYDLISTLVTLLLPVVTLQLSTAAFRFLIDSRNNQNECMYIISNILGFIVPSSLVSLAILYFALFRMSPFTRILIMLYYLFDIFLITFQQIARGLSFNKIYSASSLIQAIINMLLIILCIYVWDYGLYGALIACAVAAFVGASYVFFRCSIYKYFDNKLLNKKQLVELLKYAWPMIPNSMSLWVLNVSDRLVLTLFIGVEATAVYSVANKIPSLLSAAQNTFIYAWQENASIAAKDNDADKYYSKMFSEITRLLAGALALIIGIAPFLFKLLIKGDYAEAYKQMEILFLAIYFSCISSFLGGIYVAQKRTFNVGITTIIAAVINLVINFVFVNVIGIYAASISTLVSYLFLTVYRMINIQLFQNLQYRIHELLFICFILTMMCFLSSEIIDIKAVANLLMGVFFAVSINMDIIRIALEKYKKKTI